MVVRFKRLFIAAILVLTASASSCCAAQDRWRSNWFEPSELADDPFGAEDKGMEDNTPSIPEPMVFDLVRGLGADKGECEVNVLSLFPFSDPGTVANDFDPHGPASASPDRGGAEWAPEIEYAIADGFAIEFELPFEGGHLEAYKFATQRTFGTAWGNKFIHGSQMIIEPDTRFETWELTFLYLAGIQFNERWSTLGMIGVRPQFDSSPGGEHVDGILNLTLFADLTHRLTCGLETNFTFGESDRTTFLLFPQLDYEITDQIELQLGAGPGFSAAGTEGLAGIRAIYSR